ncbi:MAG: hypothetical protein GY910_06655 [bacterium]|nr:hypothetical protein [Deltaproteobacteria bacterium]MCP4904643.1 hypothetical protein [bacterium]
MRSWPEMNPDSASALVALVLASFPALFERGRIRLLAGLALSLSLVLTAAEHPADRAELERWTVRTETEVSRPDPP